MFKNLLVVFLFWCQMKGYTFNEIDTNKISLKSNNSNCSQITEDVDKKKPVVEMHGHSNSYIGQQIFYTYNEQQLQRMISSNNDKKLNGYVTSNISAHKLHPRKLTWNNARKACIQEGGHLAIINSDAEEKVLLHMMEEKNIELAWLGLHDYFEEGDWITVQCDTLEKTGYTRWTTKRPNKPDIFSSIQNCATLFVEGGMDNVECHGLHPFFCEIPS